VLERLKEVTARGKLLQAVIASSSAWRLGGRGQHLRSTCALLWSQHPCSNCD
jgi:hypothetical protein